MGNTGTRNGQTREERIRARQDAGRDGKRKQKSKSFKVRRDEGLDCFFKVRIEVFRTSILPARKKRKMSSEDNEQVDSGEQQFRFLVLGYTVETVVSFKNITLGTKEEKTSGQEREQKVKRRRNKKTPMININQNTIFRTSLRFKTPPTAMICQPTQHFETLISNTTCTINKTQLFNVYNQFFLLEYELYSSQTI